ncbi:hypothetical protein WA556_001150, partial [Blastocystis sp. ATCC 50177/Nand II]
HLNWNAICSSFQQKWNIPLSVENAKRIWHALAYGKQVDTDDSDDELLFQTDGKPFVLEKYLAERNRALFQKNTLLSIEYPLFLPSDCDLMKISMSCPASILPLHDYTEEYLTAEVKEKDKLASVLSSVSETFSVSEEEIKKSWGPVRIKQLKDVLDDISIVSEEHKQLLTQLHDLN